MNNRKYTNQGTYDKSCDERDEENMEEEEMYEASSELSSRDIAEMVHLMIKAIGDCFRETLVAENCEKFWKMRKKYGENTRLVILADPKKGSKLYSEDECMDKLLTDIDFDPDIIDEIFDGALLVNYNEDDVSVIKGKRYLIGPMMILEIDENGNECSITPDTIKNFFDFTETCSTEIKVDGRIYSAFRLD